MRTRIARPFSALWALWILVAVAAACSDATGPRSNEGLEFLVGDWLADGLVITSLSNPQDSRDLLEAGASFRLNVQPSGQYTATLTFLGSPVTEIGFLELNGSSLTLYRQFPSPDTATATLTQISQDRIVLVGDSSFDFGGGAEPASLTSDLARQ